MAMGCPDACPMEGFHVYIKFWPYVDVDPSMAHSKEISSLQVATSLLHIFTEEYHGCGL